MICCFYLLLQQLVRQQVINKSAIKCEFLKVHFVAWESWGVVLDTDYESIRHNDQFLIKTETEFGITRINLENYFGPVHDHLVCSAQHC